MSNGASSLKAKSRPRRLQKTRDADTSRFAGTRRGHIPRTPMPRKPPLMLCTLVKQPPSGAQWVFEPKLDGLRVLARVAPDGEVELISRNDKPQGLMFPEIVQGLKRSVAQPALLDGEIVCLDEKGRPSFRLLQQRFHLSDSAAIADRMRRYPAELFVFDILYLADRDVRQLTLEQRRIILHSALKWKPPIREIDVIHGDGTRFLQKTCRQAGEGIVAKHLLSKYTGERGDAWLKIKCSGRQEFVIGGFTEPQRSRIGLGALLVGYYDADGETFRYAGKVGTGFNQQMLADLRSRLEKLQTDASPFAGDAVPRGQHVHYVKPKLIAEIAFAEWTQNDLLRQPRFEGLRQDKDPTTVRRERPRSSA